MGHGIGTRLVAGGHPLTLVDLDPETSEKTAAELRIVAKKGVKVSTANINNVELGEIVVLAVAYGANIEIVRQLGTKLAGKVLVDIANPLNSTYDGLATAPDLSSAEEVAKAAVPGTKVLKAFNTTFARTLDAGQVAGQTLDVLIAGDDVESKNKLAQLVRDGGLRAIDVGPLSRARQLEGIGLLHITMQGLLGTKFMSAVKIIG
jgi:8-hydroxy-5-deazaflavin:NADPH oxidoreductase